MTTKLYKYQEQGVIQIERFGGRVLLADSMGVGKAQPVTTPVLTPDGWRNIGKLRIGDTVYGGNGKPCKVVGKYPQGKLPVYRVYFKDGVYSDCNSEHLWAVNTTERKQQNKPALIKTTQELIDDNIDYFIPLTEPVQFPQKELPIHPYTLGALLGSGLISSNNVYMSSDDSELLDYIRAFLPDDIQMVKSESDDPDEPLWSFVSTYNIDNNCFENFTNNSLIRRCYDLYLHAYRFIPDLYLFASVEDRIELLRGLMDTIGVVNESGGQAELCLEGDRSCQLASDILFLLQSLGGNVNIKVTQPFQNGNGWRTLYKIAFTLPHGICPFYTSRKSRIYPNITGKYSPTRAISKIEKLGTSEQMVCIAVDSPDHLYITNDFILTHNTIQAIKYIIDAQTYPAIVVCPATLKLNWQREFMMHFDKRSIILSSGKTFELKPDNEAVYIINYDILKKWLPQLLNLNPAIIVADECHYVKSPFADRTKALAKLASNVPHFIGISGTPMTNHPIELYPILRMILGKDGIESRREFCTRYSKLVLTRFGFRYEGSRRLPELHKRLVKSCMIRRLITDVLPDLPEKTRQILPVELSKSNMNEYREMCMAFGEWYREKFPNKTQMDNDASLMLMKLGYLKRQVAEWKLPHIYDWIDTFFEESDGKLIVFGLHHKILDGIIDRYVSRGTKLHPFVVKIDGSVSIPDRQRAVDLFQDRIETKLFVGQMRAAGVGITLTASNQILFAECDFVPAVHLQAEDRARRLGQKNHVLCTYLVADRTIEYHVCDILQRKQSTFQSVMDGGKKVDNMNMLHELLERLKDETNNKKPIARLI
ncbi:MAG: hypothetical protein LBP59_11260 [Planctomycetaceae bacterium]|jgi:hypothetical protein|nr:hypothetical protein [Planctomycetaceae bacterium]